MFWRLFLPHCPLKKPRNNQPSSSEQPYHSGYGLENHFPLQNTRGPWGMADCMFRTENAQDQLQPIIPPESKDAIKDY